MSKCVEDFTNLDLLDARLPGHAHQVDSVNGDDVVADVEQARARGRTGLAQMHNYTRRDGRAIARLHHHHAHDVVLVLGYSQLYIDVTTKISASQIS